jgi:toxin ParE1/3/4
MAEFRLTPAAERDLEGIWDYTAERWGRAQAERYVDGLIEAFARLAADPQSLQTERCDELRAGYRRCGVQRHVVYYRVADYGVAVIRVLHQRMDAPRHLPS